MPPLSSPFPISNPSKVWTAIVAALQADPVLSAAVDTWSILDDSDGDRAEPTDENMPYLRIEPTTGQGGWLDEQAHQITIPIKLTLGVLGLDVTVLLDFWDAIRAALFTGNDLLNQLYPLGVIQKTLTVPATEPKIFGEASGLSGVAMLLVRMRVDS